MTWSRVKQPMPEVLICGSAERELVDLARLVSDEGYQVQLALNPMRAIEKASSAPFGLAVLLVGGGDQTWLESIPVFNRLFPALRVVVVASQDSLETERLARQARILYYLLQPVDISELSAVLRDGTERT
jgi:DNA-binding NtrC family response regulator